MATSTRARKGRAPAKRPPNRRPATLLGSERPRLFTNPARKLSRRTSLGYAAAEFATEVLGVELLPWQRWWLIHALELAPGGSFRYRTIVTLVSRQNGKTHLLKVLVLFLMYLGHARLVLGAAQSLDIARESWAGAVQMAQDDPELAAEIDRVRHANGEQELRLTNGARYRITAATRSAGRGLSVDLLVLDELREHRDWSAWGALTKTTLARPNALTVAISNAGDEQSVVLNQLRAAALAGQDGTLALFEWSAPEGCDLDDRAAWAQANPGLGRTLSETALGTFLATDPPAVFRTENLCQQVDQLDGAIDVTAWASCRDVTGSLASVRDRVVVCLDVAPDGRHATLAGAARLDDGRVRVEVLAAWDSTTAARFELPGLLTAIAPVARAWFPTGPASALAADLRSDDATELTGSAVPEACAEFAELVRARQVLHPGDPLLDAHVAGAGKVTSGDRWRFARQGAGHVDALYAAAGAVHLARTRVVEKPKPRSAVF